MEALPRGCNVVLLGLGLAKAFLVTKYIYSLPKPGSTCYSLLRVECFRLRDRLRVHCREPWGGFWVWGSDVQGWSVLLSRRPCAQRFHLQGPLKQVNNEDSGFRVLGFREQHGVTSVMRLAGVEGKHGNSEKPLRRGCLAKAPRNTS